MPTLVLKIAPPTSYSLSLELSPVGKRCSFCQSEVEPMNLYFQSVSLGNSRAGGIHPILRNVKEIDMGRVPIRGDLAPGVVSKRAYTRHTGESAGGAGSRPQAPLRFLVQVTRRRELL